MGCCGDNGGPVREEERRLTDVVWLVAFFLFLVLMASIFLQYNGIFIGAFALVFGDPLRVVNGYDSFGNVCGSDNEDMKGHQDSLLVFSGQDVTDYSYVLFFDVNDLDGSLKTCVKECPDRTLHTLQDIHDFYNRTGSKLCRYDYDKYDEDVRWMDDLPYPSVNASLLLNDCPKLPIFQSKPVLNRCVPLKGEGLRGVLYNLYGYLNTMDVLEQVLADLYASWHLILIFIFITLLASVLLWWSYISVRLQLDSSPMEQTLMETVRNERALLVYAILSTIIMVILIVLVVYVKPHIAMVAELFKHAGGCLTHHPTLLLQPVVTFVVLLGLFFLCKDPENSCARCGLRACSCCLWCFENFLKYMNHNAYTVTATRGTPFCTSAKIAWQVVVTNMLQVATVNSVGDLMLFLAKVAVTGTVCCIALPVLHADPTLHLYAIPLIVIAVFAFFITHCVFSVYEMAVDTLFLCFSDDYNTYDTTDGRELVADKELYEFMVKHEDIDYKKSHKSRHSEVPETIRFKEVQEAV
ncbi:CTL-like protein 1 [Portunus trituberculatus]|uniref:Choline transporter-like protein n=1 Tax=Portunus trituberculatus TaxID=210409 RepID=A0A5B7DHP4_PORTR|nr:CTL-like protein 1 [Portunus trituberculatus]